MNPNTLFKDMYYSSKKNIIFDSKSLYYKKKNLYCPEFSNSTNNGYFTVKILSADSILIPQILNSTERGNSDNWIVMDDRGTPLEPRNNLISYNANKMITTPLFLDQYYQIPNNPGMGCIAQMTSHNTWSAPAPGQSRGLTIGCNPINVQMHNGQLRATHSYQNVTLNGISLNSSEFKVVWLDSRFLIRNMQEWYAKINKDYDDIMARFKKLPINDNFSDMQQNARNFLNNNNFDLFRCVLLNDSQYPYQGNNFYGSGVINNYIQAGAWYQNNGDWRSWITYYNSNLNGPIAPYWTLSFCHPFCDNYVFPKEARAGIGNNNGQEVFQRLVYAGLCDTYALAPKLITTEMVLEKLCIETQLRYAMVNAFKNNQGCPQNTVSIDPANLFIGHISLIFPFLQDGGATFKNKCQQAYQTVSYLGAYQTCVPVCANDWWQMSIWEGLVKDNYSKDIWSRRAAAGYINECFGAGAVERGSTPWGSDGYPSYSARIVQPGLDQFSVGANNNNAQIYNTVFMPCLFYFNPATGMCAYGRLVAATTDTSYNQGFRFLCSFFEFFSIWAQKIYRGEKKYWEK